MRQFPSDANGRRDRGWTRRAGRGALAPLARIRTDDLRAGTEAGRPVDGNHWAQRRLADDAHQHQSHHDCLQRPGERQRQRLPIKSRDSRLPASLCRHLRPYVAHPVRQSCRPRRARRRRMARRSRRRQGELRTSGRGEWQIPCPRHPRCAGARRLRGLGRSDLHLRLQGTRSISGQAGSRGRLRRQRPRDRRRTRPERLCLAACSSSSPSQPQATTASSTNRQPTVTGPLATDASAAPNATAAPRATTPCVGLSICPLPPPDAEGYPGCYYRDGWAPDPSGSGINVYYFRESSNAINGEQVTADVRLKDGATASQIAAIDPGQMMDQIQFPGIDKSAVQEVLLTTGAGRCFVMGPDS